MHPALAQALTRRLACSLQPASSAALGGPLALGLAPRCAPPRARAFGLTAARGASTEANHGSPRWGSVCVPQGERYAIWNRFTGACAQVDGPQRVWSMGSNVQRLTKYTAGPEQYLKVWFKDGTLDYIRGPAHVWEDPLQHQAVQVCRSLQVEANEAIVVYREELGGGIKKMILRGPFLYAPTGLEWLHQFVWHGTDKDTLKKPVQRKLPGLLTFQKLRLTPDQIYFDTPDVRTRDDARMVVKVMVFFQLTDVERMLEATHDPISEFINALGADIMDFAGSRSFELFKADLEALNSLEVYENLQGRADALGYEITKVVFRGYLASDRLQQMHDEAIQKRTELVLQKETQEQEQDLKDFTLERDSSRAERLADFRLKRAQERQAMEKEKVEHQERIRDVEAVAALLRDRRAHQQGLALEEEDHRQRMLMAKDRDAVREAHYGALRQLGVDLSRYLSIVARGRADKVIAVDTGGETGTAAQLHIHSEAGKDASPAAPR